MRNRWDGDIKLPMCNADELFKNPIIPYQFEEASLTMAGGRKKEYGQEHVEKVAEMRNAGVKNKAIMEQLEIGSTATLHRLLTKGADLGLIAEDKLRPLKKDEATQPVDAEEMPEEYHDALASFTGRIRDLEQQLDDAQKYHSLALEAIERFGTDHQVLDALWESMTCET